jgi:predicted ArsR family transcriptional regulator
VDVKDIIKQGFYYLMKLKTSQRILAHLENHGPATVADLAIALDRTKADIRQHMDVLLVSESVNRLMPAEPTTAGRPAARFAAVSSPPSRLTWLLINSLVDRADDSNAIQQVVSHLIRGFQPQGSPATRLNQAIDYLAELGILARWQTGPTGPEMNLIREPLTGWIRDPEFTKLLLTALIVELKEKAAG